ncbi:MAG TPA: GNAT family N-acetyltransferase [Acidimicrobiales bacterium]|nr:GNAT family N-acetyltransferase [Acidimicrobiales bacterium]
MDVRKVRFSDEVVGPLIDGLTAEYDERYGANEEMSRASAEEFDPPAGAFMVVVEAGRVVAGGGYRHHTEGVCEVKRMWTDGRYRRRGLAAVVLAALEEDAARAGYGKVILETGPRQPEAAALYERTGYARVAYYGHYEEALAFEKEL